MLLFYKKASSARFELFLIEMTTFLTAQQCLKAKYAHIKEFMGNRINENN